MLRLWDPNQLLKCNIMQKWYEKMQKKLLIIFIANFLNTFCILYFFAYTFNFVSVQWSLMKTLPFLEQNCYIYTLPVKC